MGWKMVDEIQSPFALADFSPLVQYPHTRFELVCLRVSKMNLKNVLSQNLIKCENLDFWAPNAKSRAIVTNIPTRLPWKLGGQ